MVEATTYPGLVRVETGVDWLTLTLRDDAPGYADWRGRCYERLQLYEGNGNLMKTASRLGYVGLTCGGAFVGERLGDSIAVYTGGMAAYCYSDTYHPSVHCSRLDAQCTIELTKDDPTFGQHRYNEAIRANELLPEKRQRILQERKTHKGGATYYIGARSSPVFGRIYDKMRESKEDVYRNCWRYEVETHNDEATTLYHYLRVVDIPLPQVLMSYIARWYTRRGILCPFWLNEAPPALWAKVVDKSDADRKLKWLTTQVRPALRGLRMLTSDAIIAAALGIDLALIPWLDSTEREQDNGKEC